MEDRGLNFCTAQTNDKPSKRFTLDNVLFILSRVKTVTIIRPWYRFCFWRVYIFDCCNYLVLFFCCLFLSRRIKSSPERRITSLLQKEGGVDAHKVTELECFTGRKGKLSEIFIVTVADNLPWQVFSESQLYHAATSKSTDLRQNTAQFHKSHFFLYNKLSQFAMINVQTITIKKLKKSGPLKKKNQHYKLTLNL